MAIAELTEQEKQDLIITKALGSKAPEYFEALRAAARTGISPQDIGKVAAAEVGIKPEPADSDKKNNR